MLDVPVHEEQVAERPLVVFVRMLIQRLVHLTDLNPEPRVQWASYMIEATIAQDLFLREEHYIKWLERYLGIDPMTTRGHLPHRRDPSDPT
jgi:hypothetical protein